MLKKKNKNYIIPLVGLIFSLLTFFAPTVAGWIGLLPGIDAKLQVFLGFGILMCSIVVFYLQYIINKQAENTNKVDDLKDYVISGKVIFLTSRENYIQLSELIDKAHSNICLMYLYDYYQNINVPNERRQYEKSLENVLRPSPKKDVKVKRIILYSENNKRWIEEIIEKYINNNNFTLYLTKSPMSFLGIQIIDENHTIILSALKELENHQKKHFYVNSKNMNRIFQQYYDYAIKQSECIIDKGVYDEAKYKKWIQ